MFKSKVRKLADSATLCPVFHGARCAILQSESPVRRKSGKQTNAVWRAEETTYFNAKWGFKRISSLCFFFFLHLKKSVGVKNIKFRGCCFNNPTDFLGFLRFPGLVCWVDAVLIRLELISFFMYFLCFPGFSFTLFLRCAFNHLIWMCGN